MFKWDAGTTGEGLANYILYIAGPNSHGLLAEETLTGYSFQFSHDRKKISIRLAFPL